MSKIKELVGKTMFHKDLGEVEVINPIERSRTKVEIIVRQRAKGWDESLRRYLPVRTSTLNLNEKGEVVGKSIHSKIYRNENSQYGHRDVCHIKDLSEIRE